MRFEVHGIKGPDGASVALGAFRSRSRAVSCALESLPEECPAYAILHKAGKFTRAHAIETGKAGLEPWRVVSLIAYKPDPIRDADTRASFWENDGAFDVQPVAAVLPDGHVLEWDERLRTVGANAIG